MTIDDINCYISHLRFTSAMDTVAWLMFPSCKSMPAEMVSSNPKVSSISTTSSLKMGIEIVSVTGFTVAVVKLKSKGPGEIWNGKKLGT